MSIKHPNTSHNLLLRSARERLRSPSGSGRVMSRQELAEAVNTYLWDTYQQFANLDDTDIGKLERGENRWPGKRRREAFRAVLDAETDMELGFYINRRTRTTDAGTSATDVTQDAEAIVVKVEVDGQLHTVQLTRRGVLEIAAGSFAGPLLRERRTEPDGYVNPEIVSHFAALRELLVESDNSLGAVGVLPTVQHQLGFIAQYRRRARGALHQRLLSTEARWNEFAGWLSDDIGNHASGAWWLSQSMTMAQEANDSEFTAYVFARMAQRATGGVDEDRVLSLAQAASRTGTPHAHILAFAALQRAHGHAVAGETSLFQSAITEARSLVADRAAQHGQLGSFCTPPYITAQEGEGWLRLGRPKAAAEHFTRALESWPSPFQRDKALYLSRSAAACLADRQPDRAATTALEALRLAELTQSRRVRREIEALVQRLTKFGHRTAAPLLSALALSDDGPR